MSTTYTVSGPDPRLAYLRALALTTAHRAGRFLTTVKVLLTRGTQLVRAASAAALAVIGSEAGYQLVRHAMRALVTTTARGMTAGLSLLGRGLQYLGHLAHRAVAVVSPRTAEVIDDAAKAWIVGPVTQAARVAAEWISKVAQAVWELSDSGMVKTITVRAAQAAGLLLAVHALTQGAAATKVVTALPWLMDVVLTVTNPVKAIAIVAAASLTALAVAAVRLLSRTSDGPEPHEPAKAQESLVDPATPSLVAEPRTVVQPAYDLERIAAQVNVEVTPDGSVLVHGIPTELPDDVGHEVARIAADAATARLEKVLLRRPIPNRDDRRLLTKTAREALRAEGRRMARSVA